MWRLIRLDYTFVLTFDLFKQKTVDVRFIEIKILIKMCSHVKPIKIVRSRCSWGETSFVFFMYFFVSMVLYVFFIVSGYLFLSIFGLFLNAIIEDISSWKCTFTDLSASFHSPVLNNLFVKLGVYRCSRAKE